MKTFGDDGCVQYLDCCSTRNGSLFPKLTPKILIDTYRIVRFTCWTNGTPVFKTYICLSYYFLGNTCNLVSTWHSVRHIMSTQQNLNKWKLGFLFCSGCLSQSSQIEQMGVHFLDDRNTR